MAELTCQFVRPDRLLYEGPVSSLILVSHSGELGVWPGHAAEICSLGDGIVRLHQTPEDGGGEKHVIISGGYAEINPEGVIILADHARDVDDIDPDTVRRTRQKAFDLRDQLEEGDHRRAYYDNKIKWCNLLLKQATEAGSAS
ncbi:ATP synthase F1 subunit epsilon [Olsenella intestinalis]|uniref:ATP synthase F1 subunit epsilon n=1 Tax=Olsenella intestinalis TaxID=2930083 RepID=UPI00200E422B|nr:ATP synthase F1 subunit epsilon [Olsenella intestinalis]